MEICQDRLVLKYKYILTNVHTHGLAIHIMQQVTIQFPHDTRWTKCLSLPPGARVVRRRGHGSASYYLRHTNASALVNI